MDVGPLHMCPQGVDLCSKFAHFDCQCAKRSRNRLYVRPIHFLTNGLPDIRSRRGPRAGELLQTCCLRRGIVTYGAFRQVCTNTALCDSGSSRTASLTASPSAQASAVTSGEAVMLGAAS